MTASKTADFRPHQHNGSLAPDKADFANIDVEDGMIRLDIIEKTDAPVFIGCEYLENLGLFYPSKRA